MLPIYCVTDLGFYVSYLINKTYLLKILFLYLKFFETSYV